MRSCRHPSWHIFVLICQLSLWFDDSALNTETECEYIQWAPEWALQHDRLPACWPWVSRAFRPFMMLLDRALLMLTTTSLCFTAKNPYPTRWYGWITVDNKLHILHALMLALPCIRTRCCMASIHKCKGLHTWPYIPTIFGPEVCSGSCSLHCSMTGSRDEKCIIVNTSMILSVESDNLTVQILFGIPVYLNGYNNVHQMVWWSWANSSGLGHWMEDMNNAEEGNTLNA